MLKKNPEERVSLSEVLQDTTLREALENPLGGHWSDIYDKIHPDSAPINYSNWIFILILTDVFVCYPCFFAGKY